MSDRDTGGCLLVVLVVLVIWGVVELVQWLDQGHNMTLVGALLALLLLAWLWSLPAARSLPPDVTGTGAVVAGTAAAKPLGLLWALAGLYSALAGFTFSLGLGYGLLGLLLGGFGFSLIGWSWWRPFRLRIGPRLHFPWWVHLATSAGVATMATAALLGYVAAATAHHDDRQAETLAHYLTRGRDSMRKYDYDTARDWVRRAKGVDPESEAVRRAADDLRRRERLEWDYRRARRLRAGGRYASAMGKLAPLGSYREADALRQRYREEGIRTFLKRARRSVENKPSRAVADLRAALRLDRRVARTASYKRLRGRAKRAVTLRRARAREREERYLSDVPNDEERRLDDLYGGSGGGDGLDGDDSEGRDRVDIPFVPFD